MPEIIKITTNATMIHALMQIETMARILQDETISQNVAVIYGDKLLDYAKQLLDYIDEMSELAMKAVKRDQDG